MSESGQICGRCGAPQGSSLRGGVCAACRLEAILPPEGEYFPSATEHALAADVALVQHFGPYELLEEIGRGGMGVIYKARQPGLDRIVALKMLLTGEFADAKARERLLREARIAARLTHPGIVTIHEVGEHQGRPYFAMEYVPGRNLAQHCRDGLLPVATAVRYTEQLARAVHYAHQHGVIHRDLKPANILISPDDEPKLTDFGLTKSLVDPTQTIESAGSPNFMAPEQADSTLGTTGTPTDIFGLGAILYYLLTGRPPAVGETLSETLRNVVTGEPVAPRQLRPALPRDLETITLKCLEKEPSRRYGSALEVADELARWQHHEPIHARPATGAERLAKWVRRHPVVAALTAAVVLSLLTGIGATSWQWWLAQAERTEAALQTYIATLSVAEHHLEVGAVGKARELLMAQPDHLRGWEWGRLIARCHELLLNVGLLEGARLSATGLDPAASASVCVSDAGEWLAGWARGSLEVWSIRSGRQIFQLGSSNQPVRYAAFQPDGEVLATAGPGPGLRFWETRTGQPIHRAGAEGMETEGVAFSPDGNRLAVWSTDRTARVLFNSDLTQTRLLEPAPPSSARGELEFSRDGDRLFTRKSAGQSLPIWDVATGKLLAVCPPDASLLRSVRMAEDGRHYATVNRDGEAALWRVGEKEPVFRTPPDPSTIDDRPVQWAIPAPQFHRLATIRFLGSIKFWDTESGKLIGEATQRVQDWNPNAETALVTSGGDGALHVWDWNSGQIRNHLPLDGNLLQVVIRVDRRGRLAVASARKEGTFRSALAWSLRNTDRQLSPEFPFTRSAISPDGNQVAAGHFNGLVSLWDAESGRRTGVWPGHFRWVLDVAWSGDGQSLFSASADHTARQWNPATGELLQTLDGFSQAVNTMSANADGSLVAASDLSGRVVLWEPRQQRIRHSWQLTTNIGCWQVRLSSNGRWLAVSEVRGQGGVWDTQTGRRLVQFDRPETPVSQVAIAVAFSPDDQRLVTASIGGQLRFWDTQTWRVTSTCAVASSPTDLRFSPEGRRLFLSEITALNAFSGRTSLDVHDGDTGRRLAQLGDQQGWTPGLSLSQDGRRLVRSVLDAKVRSHGADVWDAFPWHDADYAQLPGATIEDRITAWAHRAAWSRLDRPDSLEPDAPAPTWTEPRENWKPRSPATPAACVDLTSLYNGHLETCAHANDVLDLENNNLTSLPQGVVRLDGVDWDLRGLITTGRRETTAFRSWVAGPRVEGIPVRRRANTLHFLHALWFLEASPNDSRSVGRYRLHYADGSSADLELRSGVDIAPWLSRGAGAAPDAAKKAWEGTLPGLERNMGTPRLYHRAYPNPHPDLEIVSFDLIADGDAAVPFVVALTVE